MCGVKPVCYRNPLTRPPQSKGREGREGRKNHGLACAVRKAPGCSGHAALRSARHGGARFPAQLFCASARSVDDDHSKRCLSRSIFFGHQHPDTRGTRGPGGVSHCALRRLLLNPRPAPWTDMVFGLGVSDAGSIAERRRNLAGDL
jgi:hypothetical protein